MLINIVNPPAEGFFYFKLQPGVKEMNGEMMPVIICKVK